jgi:protein PhnA
VAKDAHGTRLQDGDSVTQGSQGQGRHVVAQGRHAREAHQARRGDHNIDCKLDGFGAMQLKSEFVKKS